MEIEIKTAPAYVVTVENGVLDRVGQIARQLEKPGSKAMIISDTNVFPIYGERLEASLKSAGFSVARFVFPAGEPSKQLSTVSEIYEALGKQEFTRSDFLVTLGGGVPGDMGGFAAATFLRGIDFIQVPTSLLAQVDASVGGKTGVDLPFGKNLVGAFYQPVAVAADPETLRTLPKRYFNDGLGEVIKYGCIEDAELFRDLEANRALSDLPGVISRCVLSKKHFVEEDTKDRGKRMTLNFGHTFGHALEKLHHFQDLSHGEAVGLGMVMAALAGEKLGVTTEGTAQRIRKVLEQYTLPVEDPFSGEEILEATALDKKTMGDTLNLILLSEIGQSMIYPLKKEKLSSLI